MARRALHVICRSTNSRARQRQRGGIVAISATNALLIAGGYDRAETRCLAGACRTGALRITVDHRDRVIVPKVSANEGDPVRHLVACGSPLAGPTCGRGGRVVSTRAGLVPYGVKSNCPVMARETCQRGAGRLGRESI